MRQDPIKWGRPCYDWIEPKVLHFVIALVSGVTGAGTSGENKIDIWDCPEGIRLFRTILFREV